MRFFLLFVLFIYGGHAGGQNARFSEAGFSYINFSARSLDNRTNANNKPGYGLFIAAQGRISYLFNLGSKFTAGKLLDLGEPFKQYRSGNFLRLDLEFIFNINNLITEKETPWVFQTFAGYGFSYIPAHHDVGYNSVSSNITYGITTKYLFKNNVGLGMNANINQRLGADFRTFFRFEPGVVFRF